MLLFFLLAGEACAGWYSTGGTWGYRKALRIDYTRVQGGANLSNFPVLVSLTDADLKVTGSGGHVGQSDGGDILFTSSDGTTKLDHEIETYTSTTGALVAWVEVPTLSYTADTVIYMYYGEDDVADQANATGVWDSNFKGVWHLDESSGNFSDSTSNSNTGTDNVSATGKTGQIGSGQQFDGTDDYVDLGNSSSLKFGSGDFTYSAWVKTSTSGVTDHIIADSNNGTPERAINVSSTNKFASFMRDNGGDSIGLTGAASINNDVWHYVVGVRSGTSSFLYSDGVVVSGSNGSLGDTDTTPSTVRVYIGARNSSPSSTQNFFTGHLDEARISNTARSAGWIATEYTNQLGPAGFYTVGWEETEGDSNPFDSGWKYREKLTIDYTKVSGSSNLTNFPMLLSVTDVDWKDTGNGGKVGQTDGGDFLFTTSDGSTKIDHEIESYTNSTGALVAWIEIPTLSYTADTIIYMYYGNASSVDQQAANAVWDLNYKGVWHLGNGDSTAAGFYTDSTIYQGNGTLTDADGDTAQGTGKISNAMDFNGDSDFITINGYGVDVTGTAITYSAWMNTASTAAESGIIDKFVATSGGGYQMGVSAANKARMDLGNATYGTSVSTTTVESGSWFYITSTYDGSNMRMYINGTQEDSDAYSTAIVSSAAALLIANDTEGANREYDGLIDEARVLNTVRSAGWIATEYNNQNSPSTFVSNSDPAFQSVIIVD